MNGPIYVGSDDSQFFRVTYYDGGDAARRAFLESQWKQFNRQDPATRQTYPIWYRPTNRHLEVSVDRLIPAGASAGRYRVEVFVPGRHGTTRRAIFSVANNFRTVNGQELFDDTLSVIDMFDLFDVWVPLGEFTLDPAVYPLSGRVRQHDLSLEEPTAEAAYGPVRWVPLSSQPSNGCRFDSPVGNEIERQSPLVPGAFMFGKYPRWTGQWFDFNPYLSWYSQGYHTGADLNLPGSSEADKGQPIFATGDGVVTYAGAAGSWGNIVVVRHPEALVSLPGGTIQRQPVFSRYGHVDDRIEVRKGQPVQRGDLLAFVGLQRGFKSGWHLHFDLCYSGLFESRPAHWPNMTTIRSLQRSAVKPTSPKFKQAASRVMQEVMDHYLDPYRFIQDNHC